MTTCLTIHKLQGVKSLRLACGAVFLMLLCVINLHGQTSHSVTDSRTPSGLEPGAPAGSFSLSGFDNINLYNGHLNFALPLFQVGGRGEAGYTITLPIERTWQSVRRTYYTGPGNCGSCEPPPKFPEPNEWKGIENGFGAGVVVGRGSRDRDPDPSINAGGVTNDCYTLTRFTYTKPDGTEVELRDYHTDGRPHRSFNGERFPRGTVFFARDGSATTFISDQAILDVACNDDDPAVRWGFKRIFPNGYLIFKNGVRYRVLNGHVVSIQDRNGNQVTFGGGGVVDQLGRTVTFNTNTSITYKGAGGVDRTISIVRAQMSQALRSDIPSTKTYRQLFPDLMGGSDTSHFNPEVITAIVLPNGRQYTLRYNEYGELARVELPTGGAYEYDHSGVLLPGYQIYRRAIERRVYRDGGTGAAYESKTTYSYPEQVMINNEWDSRVTVKTYDNSGNLLSFSKHLFRGLASESLSTTTFIWYEKFDIGRETQTDIFSTDGYNTLLRRTANRYENYPHITPPWWTDGYLSEWPRPQDPYLKETTTTLPDTNQVSKQVFNNDQYGNQTDMYEYEYGAGAPSTYPVRHTHTDYLTTHPVSGVNYAGDTNVHIRSLPRAQKVYSVNPANGAETLTAQNETRYDEYPLLNCDGSGCGGTIQWVNPGASRGNATTSRKWLDTNNTWLENRLEYDQLGNVRKTWDARTDKPEAERVTQIEYSAAYKHAYATHTISAVPDPSNQRATNSPLESWTAYDFWTGKVTATTDANNKTTNYQYNDALDRLTRIDNPDGGWTYFWYDRNIYGDYIGSRTAINAAQNTESYKFVDGLGRSVRSFALNGSQWVTIDTQYDAMGRGWRVSHPYLSGGSGTPINPSGRWTTNGYDALGRVTTVTTPDNAQVVTSYSGNTTTGTDQAGKSRKSVSDALGRVVQVVEDPGGLAYQTSYKYDALGNLRQVTQDQQHRYFMHDSLGRLIRVKHPEQLVNGNLNTGADPVSGNTQWSISYAYDNNGNLSSKTDARNVTATYQYDNLNRVKQTNYSDGTPFTLNTWDFATNGRGRFYADYESSTSGTLNFVLEYDAMGRTTSGKTEFYLIGTGWLPGYTTAYIYDLMGHVIEQTYPSGHKVYYPQYDVAGRLKKFTGNLGDGITRTYATGVNPANGLEEGMQYDEAGRLSQERFGTQTPLYHKQQFNARGQLKDIRLGLGYDVWSTERGAVVIDYGTTNNNGDVVSQQYWIPTSPAATAWDVRQTNYAYDNLNRVAGMQEYYGPTGMVAQQWFTYDRWGNRTVNRAATSDSLPKPDYAADPQTNRLGVPAGYSGSMIYDAAGNQTYDSHSPNPIVSGSRTYDAENRMTATYHTNNQFASGYTYDAAGKRMRRKILGSEVWHVYGPGGELLAEYAAAGASSSPQKEYGYRNGELLITAEGSGSAGAAATFVKSDTTTQGSWKGAYGSDGYMLAGDGTSYPGYAQVSLTGHQSYTWAASTSDVRAVQKSAQGSADRLASTWYSATDYTFDLNLTDGQEHGVALYALDWDQNNARAMRVEVRDAATNALLGSRDVTTFSGGQYVVWKLRGHVKLKVIYTGPGGLNATVSGLFFDPVKLPVTAATASATYEANTPAQAVDGNEATSWIANGMPTQWIELDLGQARSVVKLRLKVNQSPNGATTHQISGGTTPGTLSPLATLSGVTQAGDWLEATFAATSVRYVRVTTTTGPSWVAWLEIEVYGTGGGSGAGEVNWLVKDHLGSPRMIADKTGDLDKIRRHDYLPFGEEVSAGVAGRTTAQGYSGDNVRQQFTGHERDDETGLDYAQARYYASMQGRFTSVDPSNVSMVLMNPQSWNRYSYVLNNPLTYIDENGKWPTRTHNRLIELAFPGLSKKEIKQIQQGSRSVDLKLRVIPITLLPSEAHKHAMRQEGETVEQAAEKSVGFVLEKSIKARDEQAEYAREGGTGLSEDALETFGEATHPLTDNTSPSHTGFQVYTLHVDDADSPTEAAAGAVEDVKGLREHKKIESRQPTPGERRRAVQAMRTTFRNVFGEDAYRRATRQPRPARGRRED